MLHAFLEHHRTELLGHCEAMVSARSRMLVPSSEVDLGLAPFLQALIETLRAGEICGENTGCGERPPPGRSPTGMRWAALQHGAAALRRGVPIDHVVREYADLGTAVSSLMVGSPVAVAGAELEALHRCLQRASAEAVAEFDRQRRQVLAERERRAAAERIGFLAHELRNFLGTAMLSFAAIRSGSVAVDGATAGVLDRSLIGLRDLIARALEDVRLGVLAGKPALEEIPVDNLIADIQIAAGLDAVTHACELVVAPVQSGLTVRADPQLLNSALSNLLQNAFKFTRPHTHVSMRAHGCDGRVLIEVEDRCGGLPAGKAEELFTLFAQHHGDRSGLGLGLSICRHAVEKSGGTVSVRDLPGVGCIFTIDLPRADAEVSSADESDALPSDRAGRSVAA